MLEQAGTTTSTEKLHTAAVHGYRAQAVCTEDCRRHARYKASRPFLRNKVVIWCCTVMHRLQHESGHLFTRTKAVSIAHLFSVGTVRPVRLEGEAPTTAAGLASELRAAALLPWPVTHAMPYKVVFKTCQLHGSDSSTVFRHVMNIAWCLKHLLAVTLYRIYLLMAIGV